MSKNRNGNQISIKHMVYAAKCCRRSSSTTFMTFLHSIVNNLANRIIACRGPESIRCLKQTGRMNWKKCGDHVTSCYQFCSSWYVFSSARSNLLWLKHHPIVPKYSLFFLGEHVRCGRLEEVSIWCWAPSNPQMVTYPLLVTYLDEML